MLEEEWNSATRATTTPDTGAGQLGGPSTGGAGTVAGVVGELLGEDLERARDEAGGTVGVRAGTAAVDQGDEARKAWRGVPSVQGGRSTRSTPPNTDASPLGSQTPEASPSTSCSNTEAIASRPNTQGPHWRADSAKRASA